jgi:hypothetical protein
LYITKTIVQYNNAYDFVAFNDVRKSNYNQNNNIQRLKFGFEDKWCVINNNQTGQGLLLTSNNLTCSCLLELRIQVRNTMKNQDTVGG